MTRSWIVLAVVICSSLYMLLQPLVVAYGDIIFMHVAHGYLFVCLRGCMIISVESRKTMVMKLGSNSALLDNPLVFSTLID